MPTVEEVPGLNHKAVRAKSEAKPKDYQVRRATLLRSEISQENLLDWIRQKSVNVKPEPKQRLSLDMRRKQAQSEVAAAEFAVQRLARLNHCLLHPDCPFCQNWDLVMILALLFTATVTPYEVAFVDTKIDAVFYVNRFVDLLFLMDMAIQFFLMFKDRDGNLVKDQGRINTRYLKGWFMMDFLTILPYDSVKYMMPNSGDMMLLRLIRLARLVKLLRLLRASRIFNRWEIRLGMQHSTFLTIKLLVKIAALNHWMACCWGLLAFMQPESSSTWLTVWLEDLPTTPDWCKGGDHPGAHPLQNGAARDGCFNHTEVYVVSLHWAMMTVSTPLYTHVFQLPHLLISCAPLSAPPADHLHRLWGYSTNQLNRICGVRDFHARVWDSLGADHRWYLRHRGARRPGGDRVLSQERQHEQADARHEDGTAVETGGARADEPLQELDVRGAKEERAEDVDRGLGGRSGLRRAAVSKPEDGWLAIHAV
jgi:hypothetical protein